MNSYQVKTVEDMEKYLNQKWCSGGPNKSPYDLGFSLMLYYAKNMLVGLKETYSKPEPKVLPYKVGQILYRTSDGLKVMIVEGTSGHVALLQLNAGRPLKSEAGFFAGFTIPKDYGNITPDELLKISGGYTFVTGSKGKEMGLHWAKDLDNRTCAYQPNR